MSPNAEERQGEKGKLVLVLKDENGGFITSRTEVSVKDASPPGPNKYHAEGKPGEVTRFVFELPAGVYEIRVEADGFKIYTQLVTFVTGKEAVYEFMLALRDPLESEEEEKEGEGENEAELVRGRFNWFYEQRIRPGKEFLSDFRQKALSQKKHMFKSEAAGPVQLPGCNWFSVGPRNINGRVRAMAIHPADGNIVYAGSANAGVWISQDGGQSWRPLMHDEAALEIGALSIHLTDPANPAGPVTIYAGTGEPTSWPGYKGVGVLKSVDGGATWSTTAIMPALGNDRFSSILIDPTSVTNDPTTTVLYAGGTPGGLYKSPNGGTSWQLMLNKNISGLAMDPANPTALYAAVAFEGIYQYDPAADAWNTFNTGFATPFPLLILIAIGQSVP
jgi:hypothetical protein